MGHTQLLARPKLPLERAQNIAKTLIKKLTEVEPILTDF